MDYGRRDVDRYNYIKYSSEVRDESSETMQRFYDRVHEWAEQAGITLGEGVTYSFDHMNSLGDKVLYLCAPLASGNWDEIEPYTSYPDDGNCINEIIELGDQGNPLLT